MKNHAIKDIGFSFNYKWVQGFLFEGSPQFTGEYLLRLLDLQVTKNMKKQNLVIKIGASNILNNRVPGIEVHLLEEWLTFLYYLI